MKTITSVGCGDGYTTAATIEGQWPSSGGAFDVDSQSVFLEMQYGPPQTNGGWTQEILKGPGTGYQLPPGCSGIRFRNATAGKTATVTAAIAGNQEGVPTGGYPQTTTSTLVTGQVSSAGAVVAGTGFSVVQNSTGNYTVTFTTPFTSAPTIVLSTLEASANFRTAELLAVSASSFTYATGTPAAGPVNTAVHFIADATV